MSDVGSSTRHNAGTNTRMVGGYALGRLLGEGGMGRVYEATSPDGRSVALKLIREPLSGEPDLVRRFEREALAAKSVKHPSIVGVLDAGVEGGLRYLAQELVDGGSLAERIARAPLAPAETARIALDMGSALDAVHAAGHVHRDVKPSNILLERNGRARLTDFGLVKSHGASALTKPGQTLGSMHYTAPEQIRGADVAAAADVYSLGCVMHECISGRPPFADCDGMQVMWAQMRRQPPDPRARRPDLPVALGAVVNQALAKEAADRPQTAMAYARSVAASIEEAI